MIIKEETLVHIGTPRHSGRYPWGSGGDETTRNRDFLGTLDALKKQGLSQPEIAKAMGYRSTTELRTRRTIAINAKDAADQAQAHRLAETGMSVSAIGREMGRNESSIRALLAPGRKEKNLILHETTNTIRKAVEKHGIVDIGAYAETRMGVGRTKFDAAITMLKEEGYHTGQVKVPQLGTPFETTIKVLYKKDMTWSHVMRNKDTIEQIKDYSEDGGHTYKSPHPPVSISSKRISVRYKEDGGDKADGVIYVRPGVEDTSLGKSSYAQVRIAVDGTHYLKGMAMYKDDLPKGVDLEFNTSKSKHDPKIQGNKLNAMKPFGPDPDRPFGSIPDRQHGVMNILNEEGVWETWSATFSSQMLSKQSIKLAEQQLAVHHENKRGELTDILALTNPVVRKKLLLEFGESADGSAVDLKAAGLPGTKAHVILPLSKIKETEIYAPNYPNGTRVALVRHPHGGPFEIPNLVVNNKNPSAKKTLGNAKDAVGIHYKVAEKLSGADFDGDHVIVIPNNTGKIKHEPSLEGLKNFNPRERYPEYPGMKPMTPHQTQVEMGKISNLITDMTIKGASTTELAAAIRHSMVVIDAEKHKLNFRQSEIDNGIKNLKTKWQSGSGASTLISRAGARIDMPLRKQGYKIDPKTGEKIFTLDPSKDFVNDQGKLIKRTFRSKKLAETSNAHTLIDKPGTPMERVYADHSNRLKALGNQARKEADSTKMRPYNPSAAKAYAVEVASLKAQLSDSQKNAPLERQAQIIGNAIIKAKLQADDTLSAEDKKRIKSLALSDARERVGANKYKINISDKEWEAIQAGAISNGMLMNILTNADMKRVRELATPKAKVKMTDAKVARARAMFANGYTQAEVAQQLGVSLSTLKRSFGSD